MRKTSLQAPPRRPQRLSFCLLLTRKTRWADPPKTRTPSISTSYRLYVQQNRQLAGNSACGLIELGHVGGQPGALTYALDAEKISGDGFAGASALLADLGITLDFLYLDGQFTTLPDTGESVDLKGASFLKISLEEFSADEDTDPLARRVLCGGMDQTHAAVPAGPQH